MPIRRQGFQWRVQDLGQLPPKRLDDLSKHPQSVFVSGIGNATVRKRNRTSKDEYIVIQYVGSTPGIWPNSGSGWVPRGFINFTIESTSYFTNPDDRPADGLSGSAMPFPVTTGFGPAFTDYIPIDVPPDTNWDITYFITNAMVEPKEDFDAGAVITWTVVGA